MMRILRFIGHLTLILFFTVLTQIGGIIYLVVVILFRKSVAVRWIVFASIYLLSTFLIVPYLAPVFGREKIATGDGVVIHNFFTTIANRNYVVPKVNTLLREVTLDARKSYPTIEVHCLDGNFPFWDGFPLLPHLSHNDGKKLDISLLYTDDSGELTNTKPSRSGYGVFEKPLASEHNQNDVCKSKGYWQYDFPKYLTLGKNSDSLLFSVKANKKLIQSILNQRAISKVFIEPHLKMRMGLEHSKLRYHGCRAVRHDDHIHIQVK
ncbi:hypothetical protein EAX61_04445 [Dokdonia sinensis]|uniref:Uncharacterized protein n=1 Tax=Dokdonia sinensis TaxID=2479847 RepID=A0A3M0GZR8_9FLAO|nr:hypothetical protein [Dokdonia sinensis]RMB62836.1 hypothetical protein EAX61_04445 [Dokdonia sinensis]